MGFKDNILKDTFLVNPNLGHPKFLKINRDKSNKKYSLEILFITNINNPIEFQKSLFDKIRLIPILNFKWKIKRIIKKRGFWKKIKNFWRRIKNFFLGKKLGKEYEISITEYEKTGEKKTYIKKGKKKDIKKIKPRSFRSELLICRILKVDSISPIQINNLAYVKDQYCSPQKYLLRLKEYQNLNHFYKVLLEFSLNDEIIDFLSDYNFIMFDIMYHSHSSDSKINFHSLVITRNYGKDINVAHATDLHLAKRNDQIFEKIIEMYKARQNDFPNEKLINLTRSFKKRLINPNNLFRTFIKEMNKRVLKNEIDFIIITGDIVDFTIISNQSQNQENIFEYEKSNWKIFKDILLHINFPKIEGIKESEELLCPIFTIPGNHDYRPWQYDLNWGGIYKKVGLKKIEAQALKKEYSASPIKAILKSEKALDGYLLEINASLDYSLKFGSILFIFLNSGADSYREITNFIRGSPSLTGINNKQIKFLENIIRHENTKDLKVILSIHGPPVNTPLKRNIISRIKKLFKKEIKTNLDQYKESNFRNEKDIKNKARIDDKFNISYGTMSSNLEELIDFCYNYIILTISGHTHILNEYRMEKLHPKREEIEENSKSPIAIYYDNYSEIYANTKDIEKYGPFIVQTPALGFKSYKKPGRVGGFRDLKIINGKLFSFRVKYVKK